MTVKATTVAVEVLGATDPGVRVEHFTLDVLYRESNVATRVGVQYIEVLYGFLPWPSVTPYLSAVATLTADLTVVTAEEIADNCDPCEPLYYRTTVPAIPSDCPPGDCGPTERI